MKRKILIVVISLFVLSLVYGLINKNEKKITNDYPEVSKNNIYQYKTIEETISILKQGTGIVYLGFPSCPWCQKYAIYLNEVAMDNNVEIINYFDIYQDRKDNTEYYQEIVSILKDYLPNDENGEKRVFVPCVVFVKFGKIVGFNNDTSTISGDPNEYWTNKKIDYLKLKLKEKINKVYSETCENCN